MSAEKEIRDEAFRDWKRALTAREPAEKAQPERKWLVKPNPGAIIQAVSTECSCETPAKYWEGADIEAREREATQEMMKEFRASLRFLKDLYWRSPDGGFGE